MPPMPPTSAFDTPVPPKASKVYKARAAQKKSPEPAEPSPLAEALEAAQLPPSLTQSLAATCLTLQQAQRALLHWTGRCHLTGMTLMDEPSMLRPHRRADGTFVCQAIHDLQGDISDATLVTLCRRVVEHAQPGQDTRHDQSPRVELHDRSHGHEEPDRPHDGRGAAGPGDADPRLHDNQLERDVEDFLRRYESPAVSAGGGDWPQSGAAVTLPQEFYL